MGQYKLVDAGFLRHAAAEPGVEMSCARAVFRKGTVQNGKICLVAETDQVVAIEGISRVGDDMVLVFDAVAYAMQSRRMGHRPGFDAGLAEAEAAIGDLSNRDAKRSAVEARECGHHRAHQLGGAMRTDQGQRRSGAALVLAEDDGIEEEGNEIRKVVGVEMRKQNMCNPVPIDTAGDQVAERAGSEVEEKSLVGLNQVPGRSACRVNVCA
mgnify:CR=1 FL=1